jgi:hypothetical protein
VEAMFNKDVARLCKYEIIVIITTSSGEREREREGNRSFADQCLMRDFISTAKKEK